MIDTHLHRRDLDRAEYDWMDDSVGPINRTVTYEEVAPSLAFDLPTAPTAPTALPERVALLLAPHERDRVFSGTAVDGYRLGGRASV